MNPLVIVFPSTDVVFRLSCLRLSLIVLVIYKQYLVWLTFFKLDAMFGLINVLASGLGAGHLSAPWLTAVAWSMLPFYIIFLVIGTIAVRNRRLID